LSYGKGINPMHSQGIGNIHINKYIFNDMIELALVYPFSDSRIDRRSF